MNSPRPTPQPEASPPSLRGITLTQLPGAEHPAFPQLLTLYQHAFPAAERKPPALLREMISSTSYRFWIAQRGQQLLAFAILMDTAACEVTLLEYLAVHPDLRGRGIGRHLLQSLLPSLQALQRVLLIEAESELGSPAEASLRTRRKQFYRSFGAREIAGLRYLMPTVSTGTPPPMNLLACTFDATLTLPKPRLRSWLTSLYVEVYQQSQTDPRLVDMLADLPEAIPLV